MIKVNNITKSYGAIKALEGVSLEITPGTISCLIGPNGSGKSTLIKLLLGLIRPDTGSIDINTDVKGIGYMPEIISLPNGYNGYDILNKFKSIIGSDTNKEENQLIELFEMNQFLGGKIKGFSKGMQKKIGLLLAFFGNPDIVILDEPLEGIDTIDRDRLSDFMTNYTMKGRSIILSSHILYEMDSFTDQALFLRKGKTIINYSAKHYKNIIETETSADLVYIDPDTNIEISVKNPTITDLYRRFYK